MAGAGLGPRWVDGGAGDARDGGVGGDAEGAALEIHLTGYLIGAHYLEKSLRKLTSALIE